MKKQLTAMFTAAAMLLAATACGKADKPSRPERPVREPTGATMVVPVEYSWATDETLGVGELQIVQRVEPMADKAYVQIYDVQTETFFDLIYDPQTSSLVDPHFPGIPLGGIETEDGYLVLCSDVQGTDDALTVQLSMVHLDKALHITETEDYNDHFPDLEGEDQILHCWLRTSDGYDLLEDRNGSLYGYAPDGSFQGVYRGTLGQVDSLFESNGRILGTTRNGYIGVGEIHTDTATTEILEVDGMPAWCIGVYPGSGGYDFLCRNQQFLFGCKIDENVTEPFLQMNQSDLRGAVLFCPLTDGTMLAVDHYCRADNSLLRMHLRTEEEIAALTTISVVAFQLDACMLDTIFLYNRQHPDTRLVVKTYDVEEQLYPEQQAVFDGFKNDLIHGIVPDIICLNGIDYQMLSNKWMCEDMRPWMENDPDFREEDYFSNFFEAMAYRGAIERMALGFKVDVLCAKTAYAGTQEGITTEDLAALGENLPEGMTLFPHDWSPEICRLYMIEPQLQRFVDYESGTCSFDSPAFIQLLTLCNNKEGRYTGETDEQVWKHDRALLCGNQLLNLSIFHEMTAKWFANEPITMLGVPQPEVVGNGGVFEPTCPFVVSSNSLYKAEIWDFIKFALSEEVQKNMESFYYDFSINKAAQAAKFADEMSDHPSITNGNIEGVGKPTAEEAERLTAYIEGIQTAEIWDDAIRNIVLEETDKFFAGDCTAEEAAKMIQSRVGLRLAEQK